MVALFTQTNQAVNLNIKLQNKKGKNEFCALNGGGGGAKNPETPNCENLTITYVALVVTTHN
jgi:hypothetical protein